VERGGPKAKGLSLRLQRGGVGCPDPIEKGRKGGEKDQMEREPKRLLKIKGLEGKQDRRNPVQGGNRKRREKNITGVEGKGEDKQIRRVGIKGERKKE